MREAQDSNTFRRAVSDFCDSLVPAMCEFLFLSRVCPKEGRKTAAISPCGQSVGTVIRCPRAVSHTRVLVVWLCHSLSGNTSGETTHQHESTAPKIVLDEAFVGTRGYDMIERQL